MDDAPRWRDAFFVVTYRDAQALRDLRYKPRGRRVHGPFRTYGDAEMYGYGQQCTHFSIDKVKVAPNIHPPYRDTTGELIQDELPNIFTD